MEVKLVWKWNPNLMCCKWMPIERERDEKHNDSCEIEFDEIIERMKENA